MVPRTECFPSGRFFFGRFAFVVCFRRLCAFAEAEADLLCPAAAAMKLTLLHCITFQNNFSKLYHIL